MATLFYFGGEVTRGSALELLLALLHSVITLGSALETLWDARDRTQSMQGRARIAVLYHSGPQPF